MRRIPVALLILVLGCGRDGYIEETAIHPQFQLGASPMAFGAIPWPDDLYLDGEGHISVSALPGNATGADPDYLAAEMEALGELDGFGLVSPVFFTFDADLDPASLTASSVRLIDIDAASPDAFDDVATETHWEADLKQLSVRPANGHPLRPGVHYAAVLTSALRGAGGEAVRAAEGFAALRDATTRPSGAREGAAFDEYDAALTTLAAHGVARADVVAMAVFHTQTVDDDMADARALVRSGAAPALALTEIVAGETELAERLGTQAVAGPGFDDAGHVPHSHIGYMIHGTLPSPGLAMPEPLVHGAWTRDGASFEVKRTETVPYTLWLPIADDYSDMRVIVFQHGLGSQRGVALAFADAAAEEGWAVIAIDAPFHGLRSQGAMPDYRNGFTGAMTPDGFGDTEGQNIVVDFAGIGDEAGDLVSFHPFYLRDTLRQSVVDLMSATRAVQEGDWSAVQAGDAGLASLSFADEPVAFVGVSLGGIIGTVFIANEPSVGAALLSVSGGDMTHIVSESANYNSFFGILLPRIGVLNVDYVNYHTRFRPEVAVWQTLLDRGDAMSFVHKLHDRDMPILMHMAYDDESVPNRSTESVARALGAVMVGRGLGATPPEAVPRFADLTTFAGDFPIVDNEMAGTRAVTRALVVHAPATHTFFYDQESTQDYAHPVMQPFMEIAPLTVMNPVGPAQAQAFRFFGTWRADGHAEIDP